MLYQLLRSSKFQWEYSRRHAAVVTEYPGMYLKRIRELLRFQLRCHFSPRDSNELSHKSELVTLGFMSASAVTKLTLYQILLSVTDLKL
jgi:hypothetical protein